MIAKDLLEILACPDTHQSLAEADAALIERLNALIAAGQAQNRGGRKVSEPVTEALVREDRSIVYPIRDGIPMLLVEEGISLGPAGK